MHTDTESSSCFPASSPPLPWKARLFTVIPAAYRRDDCKSPEYIFPMSLLLTFWVFVWMSLHQLQWVPAPCSFPHCFETPALSLCLNYVAGMLVPNLSDFCSLSSVLSSPVSTGLHGNLACCLDSWWTCFALLAQVSNLLTFSSQLYLLHPDWSSLALLDPDSHTVQMRSSHWAKKWVISGKRIEDKYPSMTK